MSAIRSAGRLVSAVVERTLVRPVLDGHLRRRGPAGYSAMVAVGLAGAAVALGCGLLASQIRDRLVLVPTSTGIDAPSEPMGLLLGVLVLAVALAHTSALHAHPGWRVAGLVTAIVYLCAIAPIGTLVEPRVVLPTAAAALVALVLLQAVQWRRRSAWWELVVVLVVYAAATLVILAPSVRLGHAYGLGNDIASFQVLLLRIAPMAGTVVLVASVAATQLGLRAAAWTVRGARVLAPGWPALVLGVLVLGFRAVVDVLGWLDTFEGSATRIAAGAGLLVACGLVWGAVAWAGRRFRPAPPLARMTGDLTAVAIPLAVIMLAGSMIALVLSPVASMLGYLGGVWGSPGLGTAQGVLDGVAATAQQATWSTELSVIGLVVAVGAAIVLAAMGWQGPAGLVAVMGVVYATHNLWGLEVPTYYLPLVLTAITVVALVVLLVRRRLTARRLEAITLLGLLTTLLSVRDLAGETLALLIGGTAAVLVSLVWAFATGGGMTAEPAGRRGRAAWFLGYSLVGFVVVAFASLSSSPDSTYDIEGVADEGVLLFGTAIVLTAAIACLTAVVRDRDLGELG